MCFQLRDAMRVGNIQFSDEFFSTTATVREVKQTLEDELRNFCILVEPAKTPFGKGTLGFRTPHALAHSTYTYTWRSGDTWIPQSQLQRGRLTMFVPVCFAVKKTYSGKVGGRNDDLVIALQLAITGIRTFYQQDRYNQFRPITNREAAVGPQG